MVCVFTLPIIRLQHTRSTLQHTEDNYFQLNCRVMPTTSMQEMVDVAYRLWFIDIPIVEELSATKHTNGEDLQ